MDTEQLQSIAAAKFNHALFRKNLKERIEAQLAVTHNNGLFKATPTLITFLQCWDTPTLCIEDEYSNPVQCTRDELLFKLKEAYQFAMNQWHIDFENSKKIRKMSDV